MARIAVKDTNADITRIPDPSVPFVADLDSYVVRYGTDWNSLSSTYTGYNITIDDVGFTGKGIRINAALSGTIDDVSNITSNDFYRGRVAGEEVFLGPGNDTANGELGNDLIVAGDGDDSIRGGADNDNLYGDWVNRPDFVGQNLRFPLVENPSVTGDDTLRGDSENDRLHGGPGNDSLFGDDGDDTLNGNDDEDVLDGGKGPDRLFGQEGGDQLDGGPRGEGFTDVLTGGPGADAFYLNYNEAASDNGAGFWEAYVQEYVPGIAGNAVAAGVETLVKAAGSKFFGGVGASILAGGLSTALGGLANQGVSLLLNLNQTNSPQPNGEDVMVITDFNPTEDALFLPLPSGDVQTLVAQPANFGASGNPDSASGQTGWGIQFTKGTSNTIYAQVFFDPDFLGLFNITSNATRTIDFINEILATRLVIGPNGVQQPQNVYPFPTDPSDYTDGMVPAIADTPVPFQAPSGTTTAVYGAFGPHVVVDPSSTSSGGTSVAGTVMGDLVFITANGFAPDDWDNPSVVGQISNPSTILGFAGDDILNGSSGQDSISGGDGDDLIYGWNAAFAPLRDQLAGDSGNDTLFAAKPLGELARAAADFRGGGGSDTASFAYSRVGVLADLVTGTGRNSNDDTSQAPAYTFSNVENLTGTDLDDTLTGDNNANILVGRSGDDALVGNDGSDTLIGGDDRDTLSGGNDSDSLSGSAGDDTLRGGNGDDTIRGDAGSDILKGNAGNDVLNGNDGDDSLNGGADNDTLVGSPGNDTLDGGDGFDTATFADSKRGVTVDLSEGPEQISSQAGDGNASTTLTVARIEALIGSEFADDLTGNSNDNFIDSGNGDDTIAAGGGDDTIRSGSSPGDASNLISGNEGNDSILGAGGPDTIYGDAGDDSLFGANNDDMMYGGAGDDTVFGSTGDDLVQGGPGNDEVSGFFGNDTVVGDDGEDTLTGFDGRDFLDGGNGNDTMTGGRGNDTLLGGEGDDTIAGNEGSDTLFGNNGDDTLSGNDGADSISGDDGNDTLSGGDGDDMLRGGIDNDTVTGNTGSDTFVIANGEGIDTVTDFTQGEDLVGLADGLTFDDLTFAGSDISADDEILATLTGIDATALTELDFVTV